VSPDYQNVGEVAWFMQWPDRDAAGARLLEEVRAQMAGWAVRIEYAFTTGLPVPVLAALAVTYTVGAFILAVIAGVIAFAAYLIATQTPQLDLEFDVPFF
jgi:hypothetical protein